MERPATRKSYPNSWGCSVSSNHVSYATLRKHGLNKRMCLLISYAVCVKCWVDFAKRVKKIFLWLTSANIVTMTVQCRAMALRYVISTSFYDNQKVYRWIVLIPYIACLSSSCCQIVFLLPLPHTPSPLVSPYLKLKRVYIATRGLTCIELYTRDFEE